MIELHSSGYGKQALENIMQRNDNPFFQRHAKYYYPYDDTPKMNKNSLLFPYAVFAIFAAYLTICGFALRKCFINSKKAHL